MTRLVSEIWHLDYEYIVGVCIMIAYESVERSPSNPAGDSGKFGVGRNVDSSIWIIWTA